MSKARWIAVFPTPAGSVSGTLPVQPVKLPESARLANGTKMAGMSHLYLTRGRYDGVVGQAASVTSRVGPTCEKPPATGRLRLGSWSLHWGAGPWVVCHTGSATSAMGVSCSLASTLTTAILALSGGAQDQMKSTALPFCMT